MRNLMLSTLLLLASSAAYAQCGEGELRYYGRWRCPCGGTVGINTCYGTIGAGCDSTSNWIPCGDSCGVYSAGACFSARTAGQHPDIARESLPADTDGRNLPACGNSEAFWMWFGEHQGSGAIKSKPVNGGL